jgi:hypothetical protein
MKARIVIALVLSTLICGVAVALPPPATVSPGRPDGVERIANLCPTFSWGAIAGADAYELVVFRDDANEEARDALRVRLVGSASSWTPGLDDCLAAGQRYGWSIRALSSQRSSDWQEPLLFQIVPPSVPVPREEVGAALDLLLRYLDGTSDPAGALGDLLQGHRPAKPQAEEERSAKAAPDAGPVVASPFRVLDTGAVDAAALVVGTSQCLGGKISSPPACVDDNILIESNDEVVIKLNSDLSGDASNFFVVKDGNGNTRFRVFQDGAVQIEGSLEISSVPVMRGKKGTRNMNFGSVPANSCGSDVSFSLSGANTGDRPILIPPSTLPSGLVVLPLQASGANVQARLCNVTNSAIDPPALNFHYFMTR